MKKKEKEFQTKDFPRAQYLTMVLNRLQDEVGELLGYIESHNLKNARKIGFWSGVRLLMPIIESVASVQNMKPWELLGRNLGVSAPHLTWQMFRHSLIHNDQMMHAEYDGKQITWGIKLSGGHHVITSGHIGLDIMCLYQDLVKYLKEEIAKNDVTLVEVRVGVLFLNPLAEVVDEFKRL